MACATAGTGTVGAVWSVARRGSVPCVGGNTSNQPIAALRDRLDEARLLGIVTEEATQFRDAARQYVVADEGVGPDGPHQAFLGHDLTGVRSKAHEHLHDLGFQANDAGGARSTLLSDGST